jgi:transglutaminase-like putative cysteine protease
MIKRIFLLPCLLLCFVATKAQSNYAASLIPKSLLPYASAVVRNEEITVEIKDLDNVTYHLKKAITVLNKNGDDIAHMAIFYNKSVSIKYIKGIAYDEFGKQITKFNEHDFADEATGGGGNLYQDYRVKHYIPSITQYPYTIEYEYELKYKQTLNIESWEPASETNMAVEQSSYKIICKPDFNLRYKEINVPQKAEIGSTKDGLKTYSWQIKDVKAIKNEPYSPDWHTYFTRVMVAPEKFSYYGIQGSYTNWQQLGKWQYDKLLAKRQDVPAETAAYIKELTSNISDPKLKAQKIYEYMQHKTHYVSIQIGIGGYQPFSAFEVDKDGYGDCKALCNYTRALLNVAGIESYYCIVYGNRNDKISMLPDFASMQGNHVILCLPFKNDTTWLECTSQQIPFGFLSDFTDDRTVLACTPDGGKLMHTPKYTAEENIEKRKADFVLNDEGVLSGRMETILKGTDYDDRYNIIEDAQSERIKDIKRYYPINNMEIKKLTYKQDKSLSPSTTENVELSAKEYAAMNDGKIYFSINSVNRARSLRQTINRVNPVCIQRGYTEEDDITYTLPKGYRLESEPIKKHITKPFGNFIMTMSLEDDKLIYHRRLQLKDGTYNKDTYQELVDFFQTAVDADEYNVVLIKK